MASQPHAHSSGYQLADMHPQQPQHLPIRPETPQPAPLPYYTSLPPPLRQTFQDLDHDSNYKRCASAVLDVNTKNFIVDFGGATEIGGRAYCALNVDYTEEGVADIKALLNAKRPKELRTRWINIFSPHEQKPLVEAIAAHYGLTRRHTSALTARPPEPTEPRKSTPQEPSRSARLRQGLRRHRDVESVGEDGSIGGSETACLSSEEAEVIKAAKSTSRGGYMDLVSKVWHWHAVEWGGRFMCIGFNSLHEIPPEENPPRGEDDSEYEAEWSGDEDGEALMDKGQNYPQGKRLWTWLIICDDGTVLMFHEPPGRVTPKQLEIIRRNMSTVFRSLSRSMAAREEAAKSLFLGAGLEEMPFRRKTTESFRGESIAAGPSLLFYYLFDDWYSSLNLVMNRGDPYSTHMTRVRKDMQKNPKLSHISRLHRLARQLATLKRMYEIKKVIIDNLLNRQENTKPKSTNGSELDPNSPSPTPDPDILTLGDPDVLGVPLSLLAVAKFERLRDRVKLYALGEINDCLDEKTELVSMTFNLIAMHESQAVERLTRVAIFLTKFTFLFLPLSLITGYFSMQLTDLEGRYNSKHFWGASGVFVAVMIIILYVVGRGTDTMETGMMWSSIKKVFFPFLVKNKKDKGKGRRKRGHVKRGSWKRV